MVNRVVCYVECELNIEDIYFISWRIGIIVSFVNIIVVFYILWDGKGCIKNMGMKLIFGLFKVYIWYKLLLRYNFFDCVKLL